MINTDCAEVNEKVNPIQHQAINQVQYELEIEVWDMVKCKVSGEVSCQVFD
jgi:hypothetical protein